MIATLQGTAGAMDEDGSSVIVCAGVGYRVVLSDRDRRIVNERGVGGDVYVWCRCTTTEQAALTIYGFLDAGDRRAFDRIVKLEHCGPAKAMRILSVVSAAKLAALIAVGDGAALTAIPGIGPKVAAAVLVGVKL
jgi:Holliday junction DNA helicase RuvA